MKQDKKRIYMLDEIRGFAIICMVIHHSFLDVGDVLDLSWGYLVFDKLCIVQPIFWVAFILISGICSRLSRNAAKRGLIVFGFACGITLVTAIIMPLVGFVGAEIWFGVLHCLGICMIVAGLLMPVIEKINYKIGAVVSMVLFLFTYGVEHKTLFFGLIKLPLSLYQHNIFAPFGFYGSTFESADYFPIFPWIFLFLMGAFLGKLAVDEKLPEPMYNKHSKLLCTIGKNSLWVYIAHQPVIYAVFFIISLFIGR